MVRIFIKQFHKRTLSPCLFYREINEINCMPCISLSIFIDNKKKVWLEYFQINYEWQRGCRHCPFLLKSKCKTHIKRRNNSILVWLSAILYCLYLSIYLSIYIYIYHILFSPASINFFKFQHVCNSSLEVLIHTPQSPLISRACCLNN
jgi:hypothetical protein